MTGSRSVGGGPFAANDDLDRSPPRRCWCLAGGRAPDGRRIRGSGGARHRRDVLGRTPRRRHRGVDGAAPSGSRRRRRGRCDRRRRRGLSRRRLVVAPAQHAQGHRRCSRPIHGAARPRAARCRDRAERGRPVRSDARPARRCVHARSRPGDRRRRDPGGRDVHRRPAAPHAIVGRTRRSSSCPPDRPRSSPAERGRCSATPSPTATSPSPDTRRFPQANCVKSDAYCLWKTSTRGRVGGVRRSPSCRWTRWSRSPLSSPPWRRAWSLPSARRRRRREHGDQHQRDQEDHGQRRSRSGSRGGSCCSAATCLCDLGLLELPVGLLSFTSFRSHGGRKATVRACQSTAAASARLRRHVGDRSAAVGTLRPWQSCGCSRRQEPPPGGGATTSRATPSAPCWRRPGALWRRVRRRARRAGSGSTASRPPTPRRSGTADEVAVLPPVSGGAW